MIIGKLDFKYRSVVEGHNDIHIKNYGNVFFLLIYKSNTFSKQTKQKYHRSVEREFSLRFINLPLKFGVSKYTVCIRTKDGPPSRIYLSSYTIHVISILSVYFI